MGWKSTEKPSYLTTHRHRVGSRQPSRGQSSTLLELVALKACVFWLPVLQKSEVGRSGSFLQGLCRPSLRNWSSKKVTLPKSNRELKITVEWELPRFSYNVSLTGCAAGWLMDWPASGPSRAPVCTCFSICFYLFLAFLLVCLLFVHCCLFLICLCVCVPVCLSVHHVYASAYRARRGNRTPGAGVTIRRCWQPNPGPL